MATARPHGASDESVPLRWGVQLGLTPSGARHSLLGFPAARGYWVVQVPLGQVVATRTVLKLRSAV
jgi:hypothetical protein